MVITAFQHIASLHTYKRGFHIFSTVGIALCQCPAANIYFSSYAFLCNQPDLCIGKQYTMNIYPCSRNCICGIAENVTLTFHNTRTPACRYLFLRGSYGLCRLSHGTAVDCIIYSTLWIVPLAAVLDILARNIFFPLLSVSIPSGVSLASSIHTSISADLFFFFLTFMQNLRVFSRYI